MNTLSTASTLLQARYTQLRRQRTRRAASSIESIATRNTTNSSSIELPEEVSALITGPEYWVRAKTNRYKKLIREGHLDKLLYLARVARSKEKPAHWFAVACSKERWERYTLPYFEKLREVTRKAELVARRLGIQVNRFLYQQVWRGVNVERWAVVAQETRHDQPGQSRERYFAWLCLHERQIAM